MKAVKERIVARYVKSPTSRIIHPVDDAGVLLQRVGIDMFECTKDGQPIDGNPVHASKNIIEGRPDQPEQEIPRGTPATTRVRLAPEPTLTPEQEQARAKEKSDLIQYAQDRHNVALDPSDSLELITARVKKLNAASPAPVVVPKKTVRKTVQKRKAKAATPPAAA